MNAPRLGYLPALDGLRGLAVLAVLAFHDGRLSGGYLGVDLFFVLSGFLITSNLLSEHAAVGRIDLRAFWVRRARRLFPALLAVVLAVAAIAPLVASPAERARIRDDGIAALFYVANWFALASNRTYWDMFAAASPFDHTWSLAIEEQFYVVWPLVACVALRAGRPRLAVGLTAGGLAVASAAALVHAFDAHGSARAYFGTDTRGAALLSGAALACALHGRRPLSARLVGWLDLGGLLALAGLAIAWVRLDGQSPFVYRGGLWLSELAAIVLIACATQPGQSRIARLLAFRPIVWVGLVSYGLYLVHWPLFVWLSRERTGMTTLELSALRWSLALLLAWASFRWLEDPIRRRGVPLGRPVVVVPASFACAAAVLVAVPSVDVAAVTQIAHAEARVAPGGDAPPATPLATELLVVGDSVASSVGERLAAIGASSGVRTFVRGVEDCSLLYDRFPTRSPEGRPPRGGDCAARWAGDAQELRPDVTLVVLGGGFLASSRIQGRWRWQCDAEIDAAYAAELQRSVETLRVDGGLVVLATAPRPVGAWRTDTLDRRTECFNSVVEEVARRANVRSLDLGRWLCPGGTCVLLSEGESIRPDGLHFQGRAADATARWILSSLLRD